MWLIFNASLSKITAHLLNEGKEMNIKGITTTKLVKALAPITALALNPYAQAEHIVDLPTATPYTAYENSTDKVVAVYFPDWKIYSEKVEDRYAIQQLPVKNVTHIIYAFLSMCGPHEHAGDKIKQQVAEACEGKDPFTAIVVDQHAALKARFSKKGSGLGYEGHFAEMKKLVQQNPGLTILPSFGGWSMSEPFHAMAQSEQGRKTFVKTAVELIEKYDFFGGIDIDWEYPGGEDNSHVAWRGTSLTKQQKQHERDVYTLLMKEFRIELDKLGKKTKRKYELSAAVNGTYDKVQAIDWKATEQYMDHIFAMTYDFFGGWGSQVGHHSSLHATPDSLWSMGADSLIKNLSEAGVPKSKLVLGAAFYGRGWEKVQWEKNTFPEQGKNGVKHSDGTDGELGAFTYIDLKARYFAQKGYVYRYDEEAEAPYLYNKETGGFITFDDERSIKAKAHYVKEQGLAGIFAWEVSQDDGTLLPAMHKGLGHKAQK